LVPGSPLVDQLTAHAGEVTKLILSPDSRFLFSAGTDGSLFIYQVSEQIVLYDKLGQVISTSMTTVMGDHHGLSSEKDGGHHGGGGDLGSGPSIVDESLADIVLVRKQEMEEWRRKQESLQFELNVNKRKVDMKLRETKQKYEKQYQEIERQKDLDLRDLEKRYEDLKKQKELQDRQNFEAMRKMEGNHLATVEDLESVYERKLYIECGNFLKLEQEKLEMKKHYE
jgi:hypothetical protein